MILTNGISPSSKIVAVFLWGYAFGEVEDLVDFITAVVTKVYVDELLLVAGVVVIVIVEVLWR